MEMWCLTDTGRDSWDWDRPPAWERACFNSPEWGGGSSPVKTEPPQIVLLLLFWTHVHGVSITSDYGLIVQEPSCTHKCECSRARTICPRNRSDSPGAQRPSGRSSKKAIQKGRKKPFTAAIPTQKAYPTVASKNVH